MYAYAHLIRVTFSIDNFKIYYSTGYGPYRCCWKVHRIGDELNWVEQTDILRSGLITDLRGP
jgi:hypothetical protein